jgi:TonB family protein
MLRFAAVLLAIIATGCADRQPKTVVLSVCDLSNDFSAFRGKLVTVRGVYYYGLREKCQQTCATGPWPSFVDLIRTGNRLPAEAPSVFTDDNTNWAAVDRAELAAEHEAEQGRRVEVWVTVTGRLRARDHRSPVDPCDRVVNSGWGHLGIFPAQLVVWRFSDIKLISNANSPYDYSKTAADEPIVDRRYVVDDGLKCPDDEGAVLRKYGRPASVEARLLLNRVTRCVSPQFPELARQARITGVVEVGVLVTREGRVGCVKALRGHPLFLGSAMNAALKWTFRPSKQKEAPLYGRIRFRFSTAGDSTGTHHCTDAVWAGEPVEPRRY